MNDFERLGSELQKQIDSLCDEFEFQSGNVSVRRCLDRIDDSTNCIYGTPRKTWPPVTELGGFYVPWH